VVIPSTFLIHVEIAQLDAGHTNKSFLPVFSKVFPDSRRAQFNDKPAGDFVLRCSDMCACRLVFCSSKVLESGRMEFHSVLVGVRRIENPTYGPRNRLVVKRVLLIVDG